MLQNLFFPAVSVGDTQASFAEGVRLPKNDMESLLEAIRVSEGLSVAPDRSSIQILMHADGNGSKQLVRMNKVLVGMMTYPLDETIDSFVDTTDTAREDAVKFAEKVMAHGTASLTGEEWFDRLKDALKGEKPSLDTAIAVFDSLPSSLTDIRKVGQSHLIVPSSEHMTEDMIDASRGVLHYVDVWDSHSAADLRERLEARSWTRDHLPAWFLKKEGHMTKADRADLAYHLTVEAYRDPPKEEEKYFAPRRPSVTASFYWGFELILKTPEKELSLKYPYETFWKVAVDDQTFDLQVNRHQLPEEWRQYFKKQAIDISGRLKKDGEGKIDLYKERVRLGLKADAVGLIAYEFNTQAQVPKKKLRNVAE